MNQPTDANTLKISLSQLEGDFHWLCKQRMHYPANSDIWSFRFSWQDNKETLLKNLNSGDYKFSPMSKITKENEKVIHLWSSQDALVMKVLADLLSSELSIPESCTHVKGHLGLKKSVVMIQQNLKNYTFVCKTDVKQFYESIDQQILMEQIHKQVSNTALKRYVWQVIHRCVEFGGLYREVKQGISRGCSLSPILGALYLQILDEKFEQKGLFYCRYMDDIVILTKTRWHNRRAVKLMNQCFEQLKVKQHPDKTFIGKIEKGFDFLGYHFSGKILFLSRKTIEKHVQQIHRLYEQQKKKKATSQEVAIVLGGYVKCWLAWSQAGLGAECGISVNSYPAKWEEIVASSHHSI